MSTSKGNADWLCTLPVCLFDVIVRSFYIYIYTFTTEREHIFFQFKLNKCLHFIQKVNHNNNRIY